MPATIDDYEVLETIGQGSFGRVCRVRRREDSKELVWKEINYAHMKPVEKQRIADEVNILKELRNPFIVRYYDHVHDKACRRFYIVMEHCSGGDLRQLIKTCRRERRFIEESFIWRVLAQLIVALKDCHRRSPKPVLHRDIKPANVLLDAERNVKLADFGLAKELQSNCDFAATNVGTPYYMSPELVNHQHYDDRSDVWAVGCLLYEAAALRPPFDATTQLALAQKINTGKFMRIPARYSEDLSNVIRAMLTRQPERRPRLEALEEVAALSPYLREARVLSLEYDLQLRYHARMKQLRVREDQLRQRESAAQAREDMLERRQSNLEQRERVLLQALSRGATARASTPSASVDHLHCNASNHEDLSVLMESPNTTTSTGATSMDDDSTSSVHTPHTSHTPRTPRTPPSECTRTPVPSPPSTPHPPLRRPSRQALQPRSSNIEPTPPPTSPSSSSSLSPRTPIYTRATHTRAATPHTPHTHTSTVISPAAHTPTTASTSSLLRAGTRTPFAEAIARPRAGAYYGHDGPSPRCSTSPKRTTPHTTTTTTRTRAAAHTHVSAHAHTPTSTTSSIHKRLTTAAAAAATMASPPPTHTHTYTHIRTPVCSTHTPYRAPQRPSGAPTHTRRSPIALAAGL